jgi:hypothetical protein
MRTRDRRPARVFAGNRDRLLLQWADPHPRSYLYNIIIRVCVCVWERERDPLHAVIAGRVYHHHIKRNTLIIIIIITMTRMTSAVKREHIVGGRAIIIS